MSRRYIIILSLMVVVAIAIASSYAILNPPEPGGDLDAPIITIVSPGEGDYVDSTVNITFTAEDDSSIVSYEILIDGSKRASDRTYLWDAALENIGGHRIVCQATDEFGNTGINTIKLIVNRTLNVPALIHDPIKIMTYNIYESGANPTWKQVVEDENADVMMLVETGDFDDKDNALLNRVVKEFNEYFNDTYPYIGYTAQRVNYDTSGEAILSRWPIINFTQIPVVKLDNGEDYWVTHDFVDAVVRINGTDVHFIGCHLKASGGETNEWRRERETEGIINYMDDLGDVPIIYLGDLNSFSPDDTGDLAPEGDLGYGPLTMLLRPDDSTYGNYSSKVHNFTDVFRTLNPTDPGYTFPDTSSRIDYILVNQYFEDCLINSTVGDTPTADSGSDHYSVDAFIKFYNKTADSTPLITLQIEGTGQKLSCEHEPVERNRPWNEMMCVVPVSKWPLV